MEKGRDTKRLNNDLYGKRKQTIIITSESSDLLEKGGKREN